MLQRAIAHYRFPLFKKLADESPFAWTFYCADHDQQMSTGLPAPELRQLRMRPIQNQRVWGSFVYQRGVKLRGVDALILDLGWPLVSTPRYLVEARMRGIGTVGWSKGIPQNPGQKAGLAKRIYQHCILKLCDALVVYGRISKSYFLNLGFPEKRIFVAQNTIDTRRIACDLPAAQAKSGEMRRRLHLNGRFVFGYMGGLVERKKVHMIVEAFNRARLRGCDAALVIVGGGTAQTAIKTATESSPFRSDIHLVGRVPAGEEGGWFQLFDAYLSFAEGGLGILETMAHGKTVISTPEKFPETELLEDERTALISSDFTVDSFAERMLAAVKNPDRLAALGRRAQECVLREATMENMADQITCAIQAAIVRHRGERSVKNS